MFKTKHCILRNAVVVASGLLACCVAWSQGECPPAGWTPAALAQLKAAKWDVASAERREALAWALLPCLADPDPQLRDGMAFDALSAWLRQKQLSVELQRRIFNGLMQELQREDLDTDGFARPFAILTLAEIARADRIAAFLGDAERNALVEVATAYLRGVRDYRGFVDGQGWRHGVAHGADLLMQLALNPRITKAQLERVVEAALSQVVPASGHFYIYGESERLARPILVAARRQLLDAVWWRGVLAPISAPDPLPTWEQAFSTQTGLSRLHNTKAFLLVLYANTRESADEGVRAALLEPVRHALEQLP